MNYLIDKPEIDVVIPLFNKSKAIKRCLESVLSQSYSPASVIIVDDASKDDSCRIVESFCDEHEGNIHLIRKKSNTGVSATRNRGVWVCSSPYVALLDADDYWSSSHLEKIADLISGLPGACVYATSAWDLSSNGVLRKPYYVGVPKGDGLLPNYHKSAAIGRTPLHSSSCCIELETIKSVGGFDENVEFGEDLMMWSRLAVCGKVAWSPDYTVVRDYGAANRSVEREYSVVRRWRYVEVFQEDLLRLNSRVNRFWLICFVSSREFRRGRSALKAGFRKQFWSCIRDAAYFGLISFKYLL